MKNLVLTGLLVVIATHIALSQPRYPAVDKSPMDMSYYPANYPILKVQNKVSEPLIARVVYSRPQKNGRQVFGELVEYNKVWRLGANEATEIEFYRDVKFGNSTIRKGKYTLYAIPSPEKWTVIINKETDVWGAFQYDREKDLARIEVPVEKTPDTVEAFTLFFEKSATSSTAATIVVAWDDTFARIPFSWN